MADEDDFLSPMEFAEEPATQDQAPEPETTPEPVATQPEAAPKVEQHVPLAALQEARTENRTLKQRLEQIEAMIVQQAQQAPKPALPDMYADPEAYQTALLQQVNSRISNTEAEISERFARSAHGDATIDAAFEAAKAKGVIDQFRGKRDPWGELAKWHKAESALAEIGDDPAAYAARIREKVTQEVMAQMAAQSVKPLAAAPSLAGQPNLGTRAPQWSGPTPLDEILR